MLLFFQPPSSEYSVPPIACCRNRTPQSAVRSPQPAERAPTYRPFGSRNLVHTSLSAGIILGHCESRALRNLATCVPFPWWDFRNSRERAVNCAQAHCPLSRNSRCERGRVAGRTSFSTRAVQSSRLASHRLRTPYQPAPRHITIGKSRWHNSVPRSWIIEFLQLWHCCAGAALSFAVHNLELPSCRRRRSRPRTRCPIANWG